MQIQPSIATAKSIPISTPTPAPEPAASAEPVDKATFQVEGGNKRGFYKRIHSEDYKGGPVDLKLTDEPTYTNLGGLTIEGDGKFKIEGNFGDLPVAAEVVPENQIANVGGLSIQTGTIYHVNGKFGERTVNGDITSDTQTTKVGGINIETGIVKTFDGGSDFKLNVQSVTDTAQNGPILVETDRYDLLNGKDFGKDVSAKIHGLTNGSEIQVEGNLPKETLAELIALRPFLRA